MILDILKDHLQDDDAYLKKRLDSLHYGTDYWDLAGYYISKSELNKAVETAEEGLLKGDGRLSELLEFLFLHYEKSGNTAELERIVRCALEKKCDEIEMLNRSFKYYRGRRDYENAKRSLLRAFDYIKHAGYATDKSSYAHYNIMKKYLNDADWKEIEPKIILEVQQNNLEDYMRICLDKKMKKEVIDILLSPPKVQAGRVLIYSRYDFDEFARRLTADFPEEIIKYYLQKAYGYIRNGQRSTYGIAVKYLKNIKQIFIDILKDEPRWERMLNDIKAEFKNRPAFLDELKIIN